MQSYDYTNSPDVIVHYGIRGMKWGIRRYQNKDGSLTPAGQKRYDESTRRTLKRHVSANTQNLKSKSRAVSEDRESYNDAAREHEKASKKVFISRKKKDELVKETGSKLSEAGSQLEKSLADYRRAERIYDRDAAAYKQHVDSMIKKYGAESVSQLKTKEIELGENWTKEVIKSGITVANIPLIGRYYTGRYTSKEEYEDRMKNIKKKADERY